MGQLSRGYAELQRLVGWGLPLALVLMQFFDLRRALVGELWIWSTFLLGFALVTLICATLIAGRWRELTGAGRVMLAAMTALFGYALLTAVVTARPYITARTTPQATPPDTWTSVPQIMRTVPLITAVLTMTAAVLLVWVIPAAQRLSRLWLAAWTIVLTSLVAWPRAIAVHGSPRLATGMGGSATLHLVLLLCLGLFVGSFWQGHRRLASAIGAALSLLLLLFTGSRAGALCLAAFIALVVLWWLGRVSTRLVGGLAALGAVLLGLGYAFVPQLRRMVHFGDELRAANLESALTIWTLGWRQVVFGAGSGRVWPWYAFDARFFVAPWRAQVSSPFGTLLTNPHSVALGVLVELGLLGTALLLLALLVPVVVAVRRWRSWRATRASSPMRFGAQTGALLAVCAGLVAFGFDHYLFKNFAVSFWWWAVVAFAVLLPSEPRLSESSSQ